MMTRLATRSAESQQRMLNAISSRSRPSVSMLLAQGQGAVFTRKLRPEPSIPRSGPEFVATRPNSDDLNVGLKDAR